LRLLWQRWWRWGDDDVEGVFGVEASVATMVGMSDVGDTALVAVVGSSSTCPWVCLGLFVSMKSELRWRVPVAYDDWRQVIRSVIFHGASFA
jgi:hypothetical protein